MNDLNSKKENRLKTKARLNNLKNQTRLIDQMAEDALT